LYSAEGAHLRESNGIEEGGTASRFALDQLSVPRQRKFVCRGRLLGRPRGWRRPSGGHGSARERQMKQFKSAGQAQRFLSAHDQINNFFHLRRDHVTAAVHRASRTQKFKIWDENLQCELAINSQSIADEVNLADPMPQVDGADPTLLIAG